MIITLNIPESAHLLIKSGQKTDIDTPLYEKNSLSGIELQIAKELNIPADKIFQHLKKFVGDQIKKNDLLAVKNNLFSEKKFFSPIDGIIKEIDHLEGKLIVSKIESKKNIFFTYVKGEVQKVNKNQVEIKVKKGEHFSLKISGQSFGGKTYYLKNSDEDAIKPEELFQKILITRSISEYLQRKIEVLDVEGLVTLNKLIEKSDLPNAQLKNIADFDQINLDQYPYCFIDQQSSKIFVYES